jgi:hypothetical protein
MGTIGSLSELERRRRLAVQRSLEGYSTEEIIDFLGVDPPASAAGWAPSGREAPEGWPPSLPSAALQADAHSAEGGAALAGRPADGTRLLDGAVDMPAFGSAHRAGVGITLRPRYLSRRLRAWEHTPAAPPGTVQPVQEDGGPVLLLAAAPAAFLDAHAFGQAPSRERQHQSGRLQMGQGAVAETRSQLRRGRSL